MSTDLLLDTDIIIDYLRNSKFAVNYIENLTQKLCLSTITVAELYAGIRNESEQNAIEKFLTAFQVLPVTYEVAQTGGSFRKKFGKSHGTGLADALIAATALHRKASLVTLNVKHYPMIETIKPYDKP